MCRGLLPTGPCLQPEDRCRDRFAAFAGRLAIEALGNPGIGLGAAGIQLLAVASAERLGIDVEHLRDLGLGDAEPGHRLDLRAPLDQLLPVIAHRLSPPFVGPVRAACMRDSRWSTTSIAEP